MTLPDDRSLPEGAPEARKSDLAGWKADPASMQDALIEAAVHRRLTVAVCWAVSRRAALDSRELYEESYALNEEFREWLVCLEDHPQELRDSVLMVPRDLGGRDCGDGRQPETDGLLEI